MSSYSSICTIKFSSSRYEYGAKKKRVDAVVSEEIVICPVSHHRSEEELVKLSLTHVPIESGECDEEYMSHGCDSESDTRADER